MLQVLGGPELLVVFFLVLVLFGVVPLAVVAFLRYTGRGGERVEELETRVEELERRAGRAGGTTERTADEGRTVAADDEDRTIADVDADDADGAAGGDASGARETDPSDAAGRDEERRR